MTARRRIAALLEAGPVSAKEISAAVRIPEKTVAGHLRHIERTLHRENRRLAVAPAECRSCGFLFRKRHRFEKPGRCPLCRGQSIAPPVFSIPVPHPPKDRGPGDPPPGGAQAGATPV